MGLYVPYRIDWVVRNNTPHLYPLPVLEEDKSLKQLNYMIKFYTVYVKHNTCHRSPLLVENEDGLLMQYQLDRMSLSALILNLIISMTAVAKSGIWWNSTSPRPQLLRRNRLPVEDRQLYDTHYLQFHCFKSSLGENRVVSLSGISKKRIEKKVEQSKIERKWKKWHKLKVM